jgi:3-hydroxyisobutyrate dehydrogenase-like beta-hydroxyacid dehydrogenase
VTRRLGFIGLGVMGGNMCRHLIDTGNFDLTVFDTDPARRDEIAAAGARAAGSLAELAAGNDLVAASLPNPAIVRAVFTGEDGVLAHAAPGTRILDLSTVDAETSVFVADAAAARGVTYFDTPVSGGRNESRHGTLTIISGGTREEMADVMPLLEALGRSLHFAGSRGAGSTVKLINNVMSMGNLLVAMEVFVLGVKAGVPADTLMEILPHCGGTSLRLTKKFPAILKRDFVPGFTVDLAEKDLRLAMAMAHQLKVPMMMAGVSHDTYLAASASGRGGLDATAVIQLLETITGVEVKGGAA